MNPRFLKRLASTLRCPNCSHRYQPENTRILGHQGEVWFLGLACPTCHTRSLVAAVIGKGEASDLTEREWEAFKDKETISADEVLDLHEFLKDFGGDFADLFPSSPKER